MKKIGIGNKWEINGMGKNMNEMEWWKIWKNGLGKNVKQRMGKNVEKWNLEKYEKPKI